MTKRTKRAPRGPFTAKDMKEMAGLTYRQLNDWDSKGLVTRKGRETATWRRFTLEEAFVLIVCSEIRRQFGVPLRCLRFVRSRMFQGTADCFKSALLLVKGSRVPVCILTDLTEIFTMDSLLELTGTLLRDSSRGTGSGSYILLEVNPIVDRILSHLGHTPELEEDVTGHENVNRVNETSSQRNK
jgi:hypothetical protein